MAVKNAFIRGSVVRFVHLRKDDVNIDMLQDSARLEQKQVTEEQLAKQVYPKYN